MRISDWSSDVCSSDLSGRSWAALLGQVPGKQLVGDRPAVGEAAADLVDEGLEALLTERPGRRLVRLGQRRRHGQLVADEERQGLQQHLLVALDPAELPADPVEAGLQQVVELFRAAAGEIDRKHT